MIGWQRNGRLVFLERWNAMIADGGCYWIFFAVVIGIVLSWGGSKSAHGCPQCGAYNRRIARFCSRCGARLK